MGKHIRPNATAERVKVHRHVGRQLTVSIKVFLTRVLRCPTGRCGATLFARAENWKQCMCPSTRDS